uniref:hypothetical protein n=1 Tax=Burkholderia arboris TaxID=488730 RepID=UPI003BEEB6C1
MTHMSEQTLSITPDALRVRDAMEPGRVYEASQIGQRLHMPSSSVRALMERLVSAGELEQGLFRNRGGGCRTGFYRLDANGGLRAFDSARRVVEIRAKTVFDTMKAAKGYRAGEIAKQHDIPTYRAATLLSVLVREGQVIKITVVGERRRRELYYIAGTEPGATPAKRAAAPAVVPLAERPTYDSEYAKSLRQFRDLATAGRGRS